MQYRLLTIAIRQKTGAMTFSATRPVHLMKFCEQAYLKMLLEPESHASDSDTRQWVSVYPLVDSDCVNLCDVSRTLKLKDGKY